jgi:HK97 family phage prohead protease
MVLNYKSLPFEIKASFTDQENGVFEGYGAVFHNVDLCGDIIAPGAFAKGLKQFLSTGILAWQHEWEEPIGRPLEVREDGHGLFIKGRISDTERGRDARTLLKDGVIRSLSIGYTPVGKEALRSSRDVMTYWRKSGYEPIKSDLERISKGARLLTDVRLHEISLVSFAANPQAQVTSVKSMGELMRGREIEAERLRWVRVKIH